MRNLIFTMLVINSGFLSAQTNTSYNANTIPIGGTYNSAFGVGALIVNTGSYHAANGYQALNANTTGLYNTANGYQTLFNNSTGSFNTANGSGALYFNTIGSYNIATGSNSLFQNTTGSWNTANGYEALQANTVGHDNTANGLRSLYLNTIGNFNTANGTETLLSNTSGNYNTTIGYRSLALNTSGIYNTASGVYALGGNTIGAFNTAYGYRSLFFNSAGNNNIALGVSAGYNNLGDGNIYIGNSAGYYETNSDKLYIANDSNRTLLYGDMATGQLLFGKSQPFGYTFKGKRTLNVLGGILADSVRVALSTNWADHVFADDYQLKPLGELANYIKTNKHLPNIPTASEVANNGIELGSMDAKLLEKIEELTLYILQQQQQLNAQQKQMDELKYIISKSK